MAQENAKEEMNNELGITEDDIGKQTEEAMIKQLVTEIKLFTNKLEQLAKDKENYETQWEVEKEYNELLVQDGALERIVPQYKFELNPRFNELKQQLQKFQWRHNKFLGDRKLEGFKEEEKVYMEQLTSVLGKYKDLTGEEYDGE